MLFRSVINSFLNGFDYSDKVNPWAGLLSPKDPNCTGRCAGGGLISQLFITIAKNGGREASRALTCAVRSGSTRPGSSVCSSTARGSTVITPTGAGGMPPPAAAGASPSRPRPAIPGRAA